MKRTTQGRWTGLLLTMVLATGLCSAASPALGASAGEKCQAAKVKAAGRKFLDGAICHHKALQKSLPPDPVCFQKAETKFAKAIVKADEVGLCQGTEIDLGTVVDVALADVVSQVVVPCTGAAVGGYCWYLGADGADCNATCAAAGRTYDPGTASHAGSGGTDARCAAVLAALGHAFSFSLSGGGVGCGVLSLGGTGHRDTDPTTASATGMLYRRACACY